MKKQYLLLFPILLLFIGVLTLSISAAEPSFSFLMSADGAETKEITTGDIITVTLRLQRQDSDTPYTMHGMQAELRYDAACLEILPDTATAYTGIATGDHATEDRYREYYMNFLSFSGGTNWDADTLIGTVQFRVIGETGVTTITNEDFLVAKPDGTSSYTCTTNELTLILSTECSVVFQSRGGDDVEMQHVQFGEQIIQPTDPTREGFLFSGWYQDIHLTTVWDFQNDTVSGNMTLYAKWIPVPDTETAENTVERGEETQPAADETADVGDVTVPSDKTPYVPVWFLIMILLLLLFVIILVCRSIVTKNRK